MGVPVQPLKARGRGSRGEKRAKEEVVLLQGPDHERPHRRRHG